MCVVTQRVSLRCVPVACLACPPFNSSDQNGFRLAAPAHRSAACLHRLPRARRPSAAHSETTSGFLRIPAGGGGSGAAQGGTQQKSGLSSTAFRQSIDENSVLCMPGAEDDETADGETTWFVNARGPAEKNVETKMCGPVKLIKNHYSVPVQWLNLEELTDEYAIFKVWPTEQDRIAAAHVLGVEGLAWEKVEDGKYYMQRAKYDMCNEQ